MAATASSPTLTGAALRVAIKASVAKHLNVARFDVFLFGSEAEGVAHARRSDVDVGILGPEPVSGATLQRIRDELESLRTLRAFDLVDFSVVDDAFKREALRHVERL